jgi:L-iditol 2-dehydrogenase
MLGAKAAGADPIVITDIVQSRLDFAKGLHPSVRTLLVAPGKTPNDVAAQIIEAADGPVKIVLECTGVLNSIHTGIYVSVQNLLGIIEQAIELVLAVDTIWRKGIGGRRRE